MRLLEIARPMPSPSVLVEKNGSNYRGDILGGNARAGVTHADLDDFPCALAGLDRQVSLFGRQLAHGVHAVEDEV